jgi:hypothetical protein
VKDVKKGSDIKKWRAECDNALKQAENQAKDSRSGISRVKNWVSENRAAK